MHIALSSPIAIAGMKTTTAWTIITVVALLCCCCPPASGSSANITSSSTNSICTYVIVVKTGSMQAAGTDARISVKFQAPVGRGVLDIPDLESWTHNNADPFERGSVDIFYGGNATCFDACRMRLESDGSGPYPGWYVESVFIQAIGDSWIDEYSNLFEVNQWLAVDEPPYQLFAERDVCNPTRTAGRPALDG